MKFRIPNLSIRYADEIFMSDNLVKTIDKMLKEKIIRRILCFHNLSVIEEWEKNKSNETAEIISKYIIRMASRTTINQLFGVMVAEKVKKKEEYFLSKEYVRDLLIKKITEYYYKKIIIYRIGNLLKRENDNYSIYTYMDTKRKLIIIPKVSLLGKMLLFIDENKTVSGDKLYEFMKNNGLEENSVKRIIEEFIINRIIVTNIDLEKNVFGETVLSEEVKKILEYNDIKEIKELEKEITGLNRLEIEEYIKKIKLINRTAYNLIGKKVHYRIVNGHSKSKIEFISNKAFNMGKRVKCFFTALGSIDDWYVKIKNYEEVFKDRYGLFQGVSFTEALELYRKISESDINDNRREGLFKWFESKINEINELKNVELILSDSDVDEIIKKCGIIKRSKEGVFDFKYERDGNNIIASNIAFSPSDALFRAYLDEGELMEYKKDESDYIYYCPRCLADIGWIKGENGRRKLRIDGFNENEIDINNIIFVADYSGIHLVDKNNNREIFPVNPTMKGFDYQIESMAIEFLDFFGRYKNQMPSTSIPIEIEMHNIIPRIRYKNIIVSSRKWIIKTNKIFSLGIEKTLESYGVDRYVYWIGEKGEKKYLDTNSSLVKKWLSSYSKNHTYIILTEVWKRDFIMDCIINVKFEKEKEENYYGFFKEKIKDYQNNEYLSWHIYYQTEKLKDIKGKLHEYLKSNGYRFFFIYYVEKKRNVLRLRIKRDVFDKTYAFMQNLKTNEIIEDFKLCTYEPEIVRYGGYEYIKRLEEVFEEESNLAIKTMINKEELEITIRQIAIIIGMMENILDKGEREIFARKYDRLSRKEREFFKKNKEVLYEGIEIYKKEIGRKLKVVDDKIKIILEEIKKKNDEIYVEYIISSLIHMRLNRFTGISKEREQRSFDILGHYYKERRRDEFQTGNI